MDIELAKFLLQALEFAVVGSCAAYVYIANKDAVTNERINQMETAIEAKIDLHGQRIAHLEAHAEEAPNHGHLGELHGKLNAVDLKVSAQGGKLDAIDSTLRMILSRITEKGMS